MKDLFQQFYDPTLVANKPNLAEFVEIEEISKEQVLETRIKNAPLVKLVTGTSTPRPLSLQEAQVIIDEVKKTKNQITQTRQRISTLLNTIDQTGESAEISFTMNLAKKEQLKRAIKKVFGVNSNVITYSMYKSALIAKRALERQEVAEYVNEN